MNAPSFFLIMQRKETEEDKELWASFLLEQAYLDPTKEVEKPPVALSYKEHNMSTQNGITTLPTAIGTYGNFSYIQGPPKTKKTFLVSLLSAAYLGGNSDRFCGQIKGHRGDRVLAHFDTEQGDYHAYNTFRRALNMSGVDKNTYDTYALRSFSVEDRVNAIDHYIKNTENIGVCIIDGIADLVADVNDIEKSNAIVQKVMTWTKEYNCHIIVIIHTNYNSDKPTGHLGSALMKKCETAINLVKSDSDGMIDVQCKSSRGFPFEDFSFFVNKLGLPQVADKLDAFDYLTKNR